MLLKHSLQNRSIEPLEAEGLSLTLVSRHQPTLCAGRGREPCTMPAGR